jgi:hypothetical protein
MSKLILTRYLYIFDECVHAFIYSILTKQSIDQIYFWISELYLSGFTKQSWELLWFVYFDFYFINYPNFCSFLEKKHTENTFTDLLTIVKNLSKLTHSSQIFITRQYNEQIKQIGHIFRGKKPTWLTKSYPNKFHGLFRFLKKKLYHFTVSSLPEHIDDELWECINTFYSLNDDTFAYIKSLFNISYTNPTHKIWSIFCLLEFNPLFYTIKKKMYITASDSEINSIFQIHNNHNLQCYKTLSYNRIYSIPKEISSFYLTRQTVDNINHLIWYNWEYFAYKSPIWKERFDKYDITMDDEKQLIIFHKDEQFEAFYEHWGYEPDEQTFKTMDKRMYDITDYCWKHWYNNIFIEPPIYEFTDHFKFKY